VYFFDPISTHFILFYDGLFLKCSIVHLYPTCRVPQNGIWVRDLGHQARCSSISHSRNMAPVDDRVEQNKAAAMLMRVIFTHIFNYQMPHSMHLMILF